MSALVNALNFFGSQFGPNVSGLTPGTHGGRPDPPPADVSDRQQDRWLADGLDVLNDVLASLGLRKAFNTNGIATPTQRRSILGRIVLEGRAKLGAVTGLLTELRTSLAGWYRSMASIAMPRLYAGVAALLGTRDLPPVAKEATRAAVAQQVGLLDRFRNEIKAAAPNARIKTADGHPNGSLPVRAALYASAAWSIAHNVERAAMKAFGYAFERRILGAADHCVTCPQQAALGWQPIGTLRPLGDSECSVNCRCYWLWK